eukprot:scaffold129858_cov27-Tisochrysis_lutea.AAC.6
MLRVELCTLRELLRASMAYFVGDTTDRPARGRAYAVHHGSPINVHLFKLYRRSHATEDVIVLVDGSVARTLAQRRRDIDLREALLKWFAARRACSPAHGDRWMAQAHPWPIGNCVAARCLATGSWPRRPRADSPPRVNVK